MSTFSVAAQTTSDMVPELEPQSARLTSFATLALRQKSFTLGLAYTQVTYKNTHADAIGKTQITDNGAPSLIIELSGSERLLKSWPLRFGSATLGWDITASAGVFDTHYQLVDSALRGKDIGTKVSGGYLGAAPALFLKLGPLYPGSEIYWKAGYGIGAGLLQGSGTALFSTSTEFVINTVGSSSPVLALYHAATWQLQVDHWYLDIMGKWLQVQDGKHTSLESYGFGLGYRFDF